MKKRRVLAMFLALSIVFSSGGFTTLAAGSDSYVDENAVSGTADDTELIDNAEDGGINSTDETGPDEAKDEASDENDGTGNGVSDETGADNTDGDDGTDADTPDVNNGEETDTSDENSETEMDAADKTDTSDEETEMDEDILSQPVKTAESRILSFTDATGMVVTYDANAKYDYKVDENGVLTAITESGGKDVSGNDIPKAVSGNIVLASDKGITAIGSTAFAGNTDITYVKLPDGVKTINENAFKGCTSLKGITIPSGVETIGNSAFESCIALMQLAIPKTLTAIGSRAFYKDTSLFMVYMKDAPYAALKTIGDSAFSDCKALEEFCSDKEFFLPDGLESIGASAFDNCRAIKKVVFQNAVTSLGERAFYQCIALKEVTLSVGLETIPREAFYDCYNLVTVKFANGNQTIEASAFRGCYNLGGVALPGTLNKVATNAFTGCSGLRRVEIPNYNMVIESDAFPDIDTLCLVGLKGSTAETYALTHKIKFAALNDDETIEYFTYKTQPINAAGCNGKLTVTLPDLKTDPNTLNNNRGVREKEELYVNCNTSGNTRLVEGSVKYNGIPITKSNGYYSFKMPKGGALITAEFEFVSTGDKIDGQKDNVEVAFSNGAEDGVDGRRLKVGQSTRMFLIDTISDSNSLIPTSKIDFQSSAPAIASISADGTINALKEGSAKITATVKGGDGNDIKKEVNIIVDEVKVASMNLRFSSYGYAQISTVGEGDNAVQTVSVDQSIVKSASQTFKMTVTAYDENGDDMASALKWVTSDTKVAKLTSAATTLTAPENTITIPKGAYGEATITITATNQDQTVVTKKFIVNVKDYTPRLSASALTLNPNLTDGVPLDIIGAYGRKIEKDNVKLYKEKEDNVSTDFKLNYDSDSSTDDVARFYVTGYEGIPNKTYSVRVGIDGYDSIPLKITVKKSEPNPKVSFDKKQQKLNLFLAKDETEVKPVITNLGNVKVLEYSLEPLTATNEDDKLFTDSFQIDSKTGIITEKDGGVKYTKQNKPVVTGYLVMKFEGYRSDVVKMLKITIPTATTKPSYQLDKTSGAFNAAAANQTIKLKLLDKKTKKQIVLDDTYQVYPLAEGSTVTPSRCIINNQGEIEFAIGQMQSGNVKLFVQKNEWASGFTYTYKVTASSSDPKASLKSATVNINSTYSEQTAGFEIVSNQLDTVLASSQSFTPASVTAKNEAEYKKLAVTYENGIGRVEIKDSSIANGTYKFACDVKRSGNVQMNKVTLSVKVSQSVPTVTAKGSLSLNLVAKNGDQYVETSALTLTAKNLPAGYVLDEAETIKTIACTTKDNADKVGSFDWRFEENVLKVSLKRDVNSKTYAFTMTPKFVLQTGEGTGSSIKNKVSAKAIKFNVKVYTETISIKLSQKGKLNLLNRGASEFTQNNSITYTPTLSNLKDTVQEAKVYDAAGAAPNYGDEESEYFVATVKDGKIYVTPKAGAELNNNQNYKVKIWVKLNNYTFSGNGGGYMCPNVLTIKTAQVLPKVTMDKTNLNLYLSSKSYEATFVVTPKEGSVGKVSGIEFGEKDEKSIGSFDVTSVPQADGSLKVTMKLKDTVSFACNSTNSIKMYVTYDGQGVNTSGTAITMKVKINK